MERLSFDWRMRIRLLPVSGGAIYETGATKARFAQRHERALAPSLRHQQQLLRATLLDLSLLSPCLFSSLLNCQSKNVRGHR
jgi:hypothetical protein